MLRSSECFLRYSPDIQFYNSIVAAPPRPQFMSSFINNNKSVSQISMCIAFLRSHRSIGKTSLCRKTSTRGQQKTECCMLSLIRIRKSISRSSHKNWQTLKMKGIIPRLTRGVFFITHSRSEIIFQLSVKISVQYKFSKGRDYDVRCHCRFPLPELYETDIS